MTLNVKSTEFYLFLLVCLISLAANLPSSFLGRIIDQKSLLIVLSVVVVIALLRYLRLFLFLCVTALAIGANLPAHLSRELGVSTDIMLAFLGVIVAIALLNRFMRLPVEREQAPVAKLDTAESRKAVLFAIETGNVKRLRWLINHNVEINFSVDGVSPAVVAAETGNSEIMQLLVYHGAYLVVLSREGRTPLQIAEARGYTRTAEIIRVALDNRTAVPANEAPTAGLDGAGMPAAAAQA